MNRFDKPNINRFDKPYRVAPTFNEKKKIEMFDLTSKLDTHELLQFSLINQIPFDIADDDGNTLIHIVCDVDSRKASQQSKLAVIKFLVNNGANPDKPNKYNQTPLHLVCQQQAEIIVEYLLSIDVDPNYKDNMGMTPFHYALTGNIKPINSTEEIMDFIPPPKKVDTVKKDAILEIKRELYDLFKKPEINDNFPILDTFEKTITNILDQDIYFINQQSLLLNKISTLALNTENPNYLTEIKNTIDIYLLAIKKKINKYFNGFPQLNNFNVHLTQPTSWSHPSNILQYSLIENGDIRQIIKNDINNAKDIANKLLDDFKPYNGDLNILSNDSYNFIMSNYINQIVQDIRLYQPNHHYYNGQINYDTFANLENDLRHHNAFDNASSIIDLESLKYTGGPRNIKVENISDTNHPDNHISHLADIQKFSGMEKKKLILTLLWPVHTTKNNYNYNTEIDSIVTAIDNKTLNLLNFNTNAYTIYFKITIDKIQNQQQIAQGLGQQQQLNLLQFVTLCFIIFSYVAIILPHKFNELETHVYLNTNGKFNNNIMINKWYDNFRTGNYNVGIFIFSMWSDITCMYSPTNLDDGRIKTKLMMLISGLTINKTDVVQSFYNAYKPQLVSGICDLNISEPKKIAHIIMLFLNDNCTNNYFNNIDNNPNIIYTNPQNYNVDKNVALIGKLFETYFTEPTSFIILVETEEGKLWKQFYRPDKSIFDILINILINQYEKMDNKPHKASITDLIYLLTLYNNNNNLFNSFSLMSTEYLIHIINNDPRNLIFNINQLPSLYSIQNIVIDLTNITNVSQDFILNHFRIAHILGLYFEGICYPLQKKINLANAFVFTNGQQNYNLYLSVNIQQQQPQQPPNFSHTFDAQNKLSPYNVSLPFNNVIINPPNNFPDNAKITYYNIYNKDLIIPSIYSYYLHIINKIKYYQMQLNMLIIEANKHIENMSKGKTKKIEILFTKLYPEIVAHCRIIKLFNESYEKFMVKYSNKDIWKDLGIEFNFTPSIYNYTELAKKINIINASYFMYYYIFSPNKVVKLSKFNYFQIPVNTTTPEKYLYYNILRSEESGNPFYEKKLNNPQETIRETDDIKTGFLNDFPIGNYNSLYEDYKQNYFRTEYTIIKEDFIANKDRYVPPSLMGNLENFYKYCLIELVKLIINEIDNNKTGTSQELYNKIMAIIQKSEVLTSAVNYELSAYVFVSKLVQEIIREQFEIYVNNSVDKTFFEKFSPQLPLNINLPTSNLFNPKEITINLDKTDINFLTISNSGDFKNIYNILVQPTIEDVFILYSNDLTNISRLRIKNGIYIINKIIEFLLSKRGSPYHINLEGQTPIYNLIKNYNYEPIIVLKNLGIDFRSFENDLPVNFIVREFNNNLDKIIDNDNRFNKDILSKFDNYLYNDVKMLIMSNDAYGNNILSYLPQSFNMSTYIVLQYLIENLINIDDNYTLDDLIEFFYLIDVNIDNINKNYLFENFSNYHVLYDFDIHVACEYFKEKKIELDNITNEVTRLYTNILQLKANNTPKSNELANKLENSSKYIDLNNKIDQITFEITHLHNITNTQNYYDNLLVPQTFKIIDRYQYSNVHTGLIMHGWKGLLNETYSNKNYNLGLINMLIKQKELINNLNLSNREELKKMLKPLEKIEKISTSYFLNKKNIDTNKVSHFVRDMLEYLTKVTICTSLELVIRRILYTYFLNARSDDTYNNINDRISFILEYEHTGLNKSLRDILLIDITIELVKSASEIFDNKFDEQGYTTRPPRDIFIDFFQLFESSPIKLPNEIMNIFMKDVVSYFDTFTTKTIILWQVNAENIFKYFINNYRCTKTLLSL